MIVTGSNRRRAFADSTLESMPFGVTSSGKAPTFDFCSVCTDLLSSVPSLGMIIAQASIGLPKTTAMKVSGHKTGRELVDRPERLAPQVGFGPKIHLPPHPKPAAPALSVPTHRQGSFSAISY